MAAPDFFSGRTPLHFSFSPFPSPALFPFSPIFHLFHVRSPFSPLYISFQSFPFPVSIPLLSPSLPFPSHPSWECILYRVFLAVCSHGQRLIGELIVTCAGRRNGQYLWSTEVFCAVNDWSQVVRRSRWLVRHRQGLGLPLTHTGGHVVDVTWRRCANTGPSHRQS